MAMGGGIANEMWLSDADDHVREAALQRRIWDELALEPSLDARDVRVEVSGTDAALSGTVRTYPEKLAVERAADRVPGIRHVDNRVAVDLLEQDRRSDDELAAAAAAALDWHVLVPRRTVHVTVRDGAARLTGQVAAEPQRAAALHLVAHLRGVRHVEDEITVAWSSGEWNVGARVHDALARETQLRARRIRVDAHGSQVALHGTVRSLAERLEAEKIARAVPGVTHVSDHLEVQG